MVADPSRVGNLRELKVQHRRLFVAKSIRDFTSLAMARLSG